MLRAPQEWLVRKRDARIVPFDLPRIQNAIACAFRADLNLADGQPLDHDVLAEISQVAGSVLGDLAPFASQPPGVDVERIQDLVEMGLMTRGHYRVARRYIIYRAEHAKMRAIRGDVPVAVAAPPVHVVLADGTRVAFDARRARKRLAEACREFGDVVSVDELVEDVIRSVFDGIEVHEVSRVQILAARSRIERDPAYDIVASRLMLNVIYREVLGETPDSKTLASLHQNQFEHYIIDGIRAGRLCGELRGFDLGRLAAAMQPVRDGQFRYLGLQAIYDRYLLRIGGRRIETPQYFWMRVAMGLAIQERDERDERAIEFYEVLSTFRFTSATPTLFNAATPHPQLSSCYLSTVRDDLGHIFKVVADNARLSKWAGGLGNDWTNIRATNAHIRGTNGNSQGVIPFLKVVNDAAVAVNQGGKRKGAVCSYLETWHLDIEEFSICERTRATTGGERTTCTPPTGFPICSSSGCVRTARGRCSARMRFPICTICTAAHFKSDMSTTNARLTKANCYSSAVFPPSTCGAKCSRAFSRQGIPGSRSKTPPTSAHRRITLALFIAAISARKSCSTRLWRKRLSAIWDRSISLLTSQMENSI
jgi:ribonucleoside-diphosphate reductase alpha chain